MICVIMFSLFLAHDIIFYYIKQKTLKITIILYNNLILLGEHMNKRKAIMSIELLLIIGVLVTGLAIGFRFYFGVQENLKNIDLVQDLKSVLLNFDIQEKKFNGFPNEEDGKLIVNSKIFNPEDGILKIDAANSWVYYTIPLTKFDDINYSSGAILIKIYDGAYSNIEENVIVNTLRQSCLNANGDYQLSATNTIDQIYGANDWCLLSDNVKIFEDPNL